MPEINVLKVDGIRQAVERLGKARGEVERVLHESLLGVAEKIRDNATDRLRPLNSTSAEGYRVYDEGSRRIVIGQSLGRVTGNRPDWGRIQVHKALYPAIVQFRPEALRDVLAAVDQMRKEIEEGLG